MSRTRPAGSGRAARTQDTAGLGGLPAASGREELDTRAEPAAKLLEQRRLVGGVCEGLADEGCDKLAVRHAAADRELVEEPTGRRGGVEQRDHAARGARRIDVVPPDLAQARSLDEEGLAPHGASGDLFTAGGVKRRCSHHEEPRTARVATQYGALCRLRAPVSRSIAPRSGRVCVRPARDARVMPVVASGRLGPSRVISGALGCSRAISGDLGRSRVLSGGHRRHPRSELRRSRPRGRCPSSAGPALPPRASRAGTRPRLWRR